MKNIITVSFVLVLSGCLHNHFKSSDLARTKDQISAGALMGPGVQAAYSGNSAKAILTKSDNTATINTLLRDYKTECEKPSQEKLAPALVPFLAAIPKLIYDISADRTNRELEALKKTVSSSYSVDFLIPKGKIKDYQCLIVIRHDKDLNVGAALAYKITASGDILTLSPQFMWAKNTTANTQQVKEGEKEEVTFMSGISLQGIGKQDNGLPIIASSGQDAKKLGVLKLGSENPKLIKEGLSIGPVPLISTSSVTILRVSVTEVGDLGFDVDEKIAENKTIKEAIGSAISDAVKAQFDD